jgi:hypothetical protein
VDIPIASSMVGNPEVGYFGFAGAFFAAEAVNFAHEVEL